MSNRWKVEKSYGKWSASKQTIWGFGLAPRYFETHAEAMVYAAERARTVEVTLPRVNGRAEIQPGGTYDQPIVIEQRTNGDYRISEGELEKGLLGLGIPFVDLAPDEIEPVALTLLALARKGDSGGA